MVLTEDDDVQVKAIVKKYGLKRRKNHYFFVIDEHHLYDIIEFTRYSCNDYQIRVYLSQLYSFEAGKTKGREVKNILLAEFDMIMAKILLSKVFG